MSKKVWIVTSLLIVVLLGIYLSIPNKQATLMDDMVGLDRNYIPVLAYTSQDKLELSNKAMNKLLPVWDSFMKKYKNKEKRDPDWSEDMDNINSYINSAATLITEGKNIQDAHEQLEHVRKIMMNARERNHIDYYPDLLTQFHEPMEGLVLSVKGKKAAQLSDETIASMREQLGTANYTWQKLVNSKFDRNIYNFSDKKTAKLKMLIDTETQALSYLGEALDSGEKTAIIKAAMAIKPPFASIYLMFGDFSEFK